MNDPRFDAIFDNHKFNIDPSDQQFKKTRAMEQLLEEKNKRKIIETTTNEVGDGAQQEDTKKVKNDTASVSLLVNSIKSKADAMVRRKKEIKNRQNRIKFSILK